VRSIWLRFYAAQALATLIALAVVAVVGLRVERAVLLERNSGVLLREARLVARELAAAPAPRDWALAARAADGRTGLRVTLIQPGGHVFADSRADTAYLENHAARPEVRGALAGEAATDVRHSESLGADLQYAAVPAEPGLPFAVVRVAEPLDFLRQLGRARAGGLALALVLALAASLLAAMWLGHRQLGRVVELQRVARRLGAGDAGARAPERPDDALGRLGASLNAMARELRARLVALERERDEREHVLAHMSDGVALVDAGDRILHCNHSLASLLGAPRPAPPGTPLLSFARVPEVGDLLARARSAGHEVQDELRLWSPEPRVLRASATSLGDEEAGAVLLVVHDLTEAERVNRIRQDFVANVSHELRTPLTSLRGYAETLLDGGLEDAEHRERFVRIIRDQAVRLQELVDDLLSLAELERAGAPLRRTRFDLRALAAEQIAAFRAPAARAGLALALGPGEAVEVEADRARLSQVIANLLDNAVKYTESGGVTVSAGHEGGRAWCEVRDTGPGIPADDQPRVFERFYRVDKARSREQGGTGLGLSIVKHILALHGGEVSLRSTPGEGSVFRFELPRRPGGTAG
jgi:two-component system phosphate regulon sensor histidine kinase PhoR